MKPNRTARTRWMFAVTVVMTAAAAAPTKAQAILTGLGTLGGNTSGAVAINNAGQVVGFSTISTSSGQLNRAFLYSGGVMTDLGTLGGLTSIAIAISDNGQIAGFSLIAGTPGVQSTHPFRYSGGVMTDLGTLSGGDYGQGRGINNAGQVAGYSFTSANGNSHAFLHSGGVMTDLGTLGGSESFASAINNAGQIVGRSQIAGGAEHAFVYSGGVMTDLGTLGGASSSANAINDAGQIVGTSDTAGGARHFFLYSGGVMTDLGTPGFGANNFSVTDINNAGQIVGYSDLNFNNSRAFLYGDGVTIDLNSLIDPSSGWVLNIAYGINDAGQIVGQGTHNGQREAWLLTVTGIPEPSSLLLAGPAVTGGWLLRRRRSPRGATATALPAADHAAAADLAHHAVAGHRRQVTARRATGRGATPVGTGRVGVVVGGAERIARAERVGVQGFARPRGEVGGRVWVAWRVHGRGSAF